MCDLTLGPTDAGRAVQDDEPDRGLESAAGSFLSLLPRPQLQHASSRGGSSRPAWRTFTAASWLLGYFRGSGPDGFAEAADPVLGDVNHVHPFREDNWPTQLQYLKQVAARRAPHRPHADRPCCLPGGLSSFQRGRLRNDPVFLPPTAGPAGCRVLRRRPASVPIRAPRSPERESLTGSGAAGIGDCIDPHIATKRSSPLSRRSSRQGRQALETRSPTRYSFAWRLWTWTW